MRRDREIMLDRHCERSEAIHFVAQRKNELLRCARNDGFRIRRPGDGCPLNLPIPPLRRRPARISWPPATRPPAATPETMTDAIGEPEMSGMLLFSPLTIRGVELKNRIVVPPMHQYSACLLYTSDAA